MGTSLTLRFNMTQIKCKMQSEIFRLRFTTPNMTIKCKMQNVKRKVRIKANLIKNLRIGRLTHIFMIKIT